MRAGSRRRRAGALGGVVLLLAALAAASHADTPVPNGDFEAGTTGWSVLPGTLVVDDSLPGPVGPNAAHIATTTEDDFSARLRSSTTFDVGPGGRYAASLWIYDDHPDATVAVYLRFSRADGQPTGYPPAVDLEGDAPAFRLVTVEDTAPHDARYAHLMVDATLPPGVTVAIDGVTFTEVAPPPPSTPTAAATPTVAPTAVPSATPTPVPTSTPRPMPTPIASTLRNASFEDGHAGWQVLRGRLTIEPAISSAFGPSLVLRADGDTTIWVQQLVAVTPGSWYDANAVLAPLEGVAGAWLRVAWYASADGSGAQMSTRDSSTVASPGANAVAKTYEAVSTGPVQAPPDARSARVRILLQPASPGAAVAIDDVAILQVAAPTPTPPPAPSPTATPSRTPTPTPTPTPRAVASEAPATPTPAANLAPAPAPPAATSPSSFSATPAPEPGQRWLRITEVMPDPVAPGRDADHEWLEVTNLGPARVSLEGMSLRDNSSATPLPALVVDGGGSVVIAAPLAEVDAHARLDGPIGNGLGNTGDRLELSDPTGAVVDALAYGAGTDVPAPRTGESLHRWFDIAGNAAGASSGPPTPGAYSIGAPDSPQAAQPREATPASTPHPEEPAVVANADRDDNAWIFLLAIGGGALGGAVFQRLSALARPRKDDAE